MGEGAKRSVNAALTPFTVPAGVSASENSGRIPPVPPEVPVPQAPELPSTCMQSPRFPAAASIWPEGLMMAVRPMLKPAPSVARTAKAFAKPVTSPIWIGAVEGAEPTTTPLDRRTSRTRSLGPLGGTAHTSVN